MDPLRHGRDVPGTGIHVAEVPGSSEPCSCQSSCHRVPRSWRSIFAGITALTAGSIFLMWLGEQIDKYGIGNGVSLILDGGNHFTDAPGHWPISSPRRIFRLQATEGNIGIVGILFLVAAFVIVVAGAILITVAQRRIPIQQARHTRGRRDLRWPAALSAASGKPCRRHADHLCQLAADLPGNLPGLSQLIGFAGSPSLVAVVCHLPELRISSSGNIPTSSVKSYPDLLLQLLLDYGRLQP